MKVVALDVLYLSSKYTFVISLLKKKLDPKVGTRLTQYEPRSRRQTGVVLCGFLQLECHFQDFYSLSSHEYCIKNWHSSCNFHPKKNRVV